MLGVVIALPTYGLLGPPCGDEQPSSARSSGDPSDAAPGAEQRPPISAGTAVGGISLLLRAGLALQKEGASRLVLAVARADSALAERTRADPRLRLPVEILVAGSAAGAFEHLASQAREPFLLTAYEVVTDPMVLRKLREAPAPPSAGGWRAASAGQALGPIRGSPELWTELRDALGLAADGSAQAPACPDS